MSASAADTVQLVVVEEVETVYRVPRDKIPSGPVQDYDEDAVLALIEGAPVVEVNVRERDHWVKDED